MISACHTFDVSSNKLPNKTVVGCHNKGVGVNKLEL